MRVCEIKGISQTLRRGVGFASCLFGLLASFFPCLPFLLACLSFFSQYFLSKQVN
jgi:hypothetical protein